MAALRMAVVGFLDGLAGFAGGTWLGVQAFVGFWDPLGLATDGDVMNLSLRSEIWNDHISMLATMEYTTPDLTGMLPGILSSSKRPTFPRSRTV